MWLKVLSSEADGARLSWGNLDGPYEETYVVGLATLRKAAAQVRKRLDELARWAAQADPAQLPGILKALATAGFELRRALFDAPTERDLLIAHDVEAWVRAQEEKGDYKLRITTNHSVQIPWGLTFDEDPYALENLGTSLDAFSKFWCLKYSLSATLNGYSRKENPTRAAERCRLLSLINRYSADAVSTNAQDIAAAFEDLLRTPIGVAYDLKRCQELIEAAGTGDTIFHFFGHQQGGELDLGDGETVNLFRFKMLIDRLADARNSAQKPYGLIFINGCEGAFGDSDYSFLPAAERPGFCGLIAAESIVPRDFAAKFALLFLRSLLDTGASVGETMDRLRRDKTLWPLSLMYGCYAQPDYRIARATASA